MNILQRYIIWLSRISYCRGFGIQSPTDYGFVRYVVNEHWPYYAYATFRKWHDTWLTAKMGRLFFRLANWRQPSCVVSDSYQDYIREGCHKTVITDDTSAVELVRIDTDGNQRLRYEHFSKLTDDRSVIVIDNIYRDWSFWNEVIGDSRVSVTFDLYYCGIVMFDSKRVKQNYKINF